MKKVFLIILCSIIVFSFTACEGMEQLDVIGDKLIISVIHTIETDDVEDFTNLFLPSFVKSNEKEIEEVFYRIREYYQGRAVAYAWQLSEGESSRGRLIFISQTQISSIEPVKASSASLYRRYYIKTDEEEYLLSFSWVQNGDRSSGLVAIHITQCGYGISRGS
jgi:hypothetical protein